MPATPTPAPPTVTVTVPAASPTAVPPGQAWPPVLAPQPAAPAATAPPVTAPPPAQGSVIDGGLGNTGFAQQISQIGTQTGNLATQTTGLNIGKPMGVTLVVLLFVAALGVVFRVATRSWSQTQSTNKKVAMDHFITTIIGQVTIVGVIGAGAILLIWGLWTLAVGLFTG